MAYNNRYASVGAAFVRTVCAVAFVSFSFCYLYFYQADLIAATQHILSGGATTYDNLVGASLLTVLLWALQLGVYAATRLRGYSHALTFVPSTMALAALTAVDLTDDGQCRWSSLWWLAVVALVVWLAVVYMARQLPPRKVVVGKLQLSLWINMLTLGAECLFVGIAGNGNDVLHYRLRMERCLQRHDYNEALLVGARSMRTDKNMTMLRIFALAHNGEMGERLFTFPVAGSSKDILPMPSGDGSRCIMLPADSIYRLLGARPRPTQDVPSYLNALRRSGQATRAVGDYQLCAYLIDRDIDAFARALPIYYGSIDERLPRHYREALTLYVHTRSNPSIVYHDGVTEANYNDFVNQLRQQPGSPSLNIALYELYHDTYWWYYASAQ